MNDERFTPQAKWMADPRARFPRYLTHETARINGCFSCCKSFSRDQFPKDSGYPDGKWQLTCRHCGTSTYYDCWEKDVV